MGWKWNKKGVYRSDSVGSTDLERAVDAYNEYANKEIARLRNSFLLQVGVDSFKRMSEAYEFDVACHENRWWDHDGYVEP